MFTIYLACLIFGGILLGASLISFGGSESGGSDTGDLTADSDVGHDVDLAHNSDLSHQTDIHHDADLTSTGTSSHITEISKSIVFKEAAHFFSFRNLIFFMSFFGLTGTSFSLLNFSGLTTFFSSALMGSFSYVFGYSLMKYLRNSESGKEIKMSELIGKTGIAGLPITKEKAGKVIVYTGTFTREYSAKLSEASKSEIIKPKEKILVIDITDNCLIIDNIEV